MKYALCALRTGSGKEDYFTYHIPAELESGVKIGSYVKLSFRNKITQGIVFEFVSKPHFKTKAILEVSACRLPEYFRDLAIWMSENHGASLSQTLKAMIPINLFIKRRETGPKDDPAPKRRVISLTDEQKNISDYILDHRQKPHLIFGVTGSGKTEVYLKVLEKIISEGKQAVILVPEISLTPQTLARFEERFPGNTAVYHSNLKETERTAVWNQVCRLEKNIVIGSRSALFLPFQNLGVLIIDEEHETSYKQDQAPRYLARDVGSKIAELTGAILILGSATPSINTYYAARKGTYKLHTLSNRFVQKLMPEIEIVDMRHEFQYGNKSIISTSLQKELEAVLYRQKQAILFMNRRGLATFVLCRDCGFVERCPNCDLSLTYHGTYETGSLFCHHCNFQKKTALVCPVCHSTAIRYFGKGTQKVEEEIRKIFPKARIERMDSDSVRKNHGLIFENFKNHKFDILIGTQMIAKGWDLPNVDLVGVIAADQDQNIPDFRATERAFSLLIQVSGRTGRGSNRGKAIIQSYNPENRIFKYLRNHDYESFFEEEIKHRKELEYPPFSRLITLTYSNKVESQAKKEAARMKESLAKELGEKVEILGPSPAFLPKINGSFIWQLTLRLDCSLQPRDVLQSVLKYASTNWKVDVNP